MWQVFFVTSQAPHFCDSQASQFFNDAAKLKNISFVQLKIALHSKDILDVKEVNSRCLIKL